MRIHLSALLVLAAIAVAVWPSPATVARGEEKAPKLTPEEVLKQWSFTAPTLKAAGKVSAGVQSNGDKLRWQQITVRLDDLSYAETYARVVKFYADRCGSDFAYDPKLMQGGVKGESKRGRFIFSEVRADPRELSFVFDAADYTVSGLVRPAPEKGELEVLLTIAVR
jgi:hypothetical protein